MKACRKQKYTEPGRRIATGVAAAALLATGAASSPALADKAETQAEIRALKAELLRLEGKVEARERAARQGAKTRGGNARVIKGEEVASAPDKFYFKGVSITPGGYVALDSIWRQHWLGADTSTPFWQISYPNVPASHVNEFRFSARESRQTLLMQGDVNPATHLTGWLETDFLGAAQTANSNESNSYNPRLRQLYINAEWDSLGLHLLAGQPWSLATLNSSGIRPDSLGNPPLIDGNVMVGYTYKRQPGLRITKDFNKQFWVSFAAEAGAVTYTFPGSGVPSAGLTTLPGAPIIGTTGIFGAPPAAAPLVFPALFGAPPGGSLFNSANAYSFNRLPDLIAKAAYDTSLMDHNIHVEGFGMLRDFTDRVWWGNHSVWAGSGGGGVIVSVIPKWLDAQGNTLIGSGIGQYGPGQLGDATYSLTGAPLPTYERIFNAGFVAHVTPQTDAYVFAGGEFQSKSAQVAVLGKTLFVGGLGNPLYNNAGCTIENPIGLPAVFSACSGQIKALRELTGGFWHTIYAGDFGKLKAGVQYAHYVKDAFQGFGVTPKATENQIYTSLRYYPF